MILWWRRLALAGLWLWASVEAVDRAGAMIRKASGRYDASGSNFGGDGDSTLGARQLGRDRKLVFQKAKDGGRTASEAVGYNDASDTIRGVHSSGRQRGDIFGNLADGGVGSVKARGAGKDANAQHFPQQTSDGAQSQFAGGSGSQRFRGLGTRSKACKRGTKDCRFKAYDESKRSRLRQKEVSLVPTNSQDAGDEGYFLVGQDSNADPVYYHTECVRRGRDPCATTKSYLVNPKQNERVECRADSTRTGVTCCNKKGCPPSDPQCRSASSQKCEVEAITDADGRTSVKYKGILVQDSACEQRRRSSDAGGFCAAGKGIFKASADKVEGTSSDRCYQRRRGGKEIVVSKGKYVRESRDPNNFEFPECGFIRGDLTFKGSWTNQQLKNIMANIGLQVHCSVSPVGKLQCRDQGVCPAKGLKGDETDCFYCNLCEKPRHKDTVFEGDAVQLPCTSSARVGQRVPYEAKVCPPADKDTLVCPKFGTSALSGYWQKKGDIDCRLEVYWRDNSKTLTDWRREFDQKRGQTGLAALINKVEFTLPEQQLRLSGVRPGSPGYEDAVFNLWVQGKQDKGELVGCQTFVMDYGAGKGASDLLSVYKATKDASSGGLASIIGWNPGRGKKCTKS